MPKELALDDDELMKRIKANDQRSFAILFDRHSSAVFGYCMRTLAGNSAMAEDISQNVWLKVVRASETYTAKGTFKAWLMTITRNETITQIRKQLPLSETDIDERADVKSDFDLESTLLKAHDAASVRNAMDSLTNAQRLALILWVEEEASYDTIAEKLELSPTAVRGLLYRAKQELRRLLEKK